MPDQAGARATACLALADGTCYLGQGYGAAGEVAGTLGFVTAMTGYQEILSDPARSGQIVAFTFPHIGNTGTTPEDETAAEGGVLGLVTAQLPTEPSNWRATGDLPGWLAGRGMVGIAYIDTRRLTLHLRSTGPQGAALAYDPAGQLDPEALIARARELPVAALTTR